MQELFIITRDFLLETANATGLTYKEVNVVIWYFFIPFTWAVLFDVIFGRHRGKLIVCLAGAIFGIALALSGSTEWLFDKSCEFLLGSNVGGNYVNASVIICLFIPVVVYAIMIPWACVSLWKRRGRSLAVDASDE